MASLSYKPFAFNALFLVSSCLSIRRSIELTCAKKRKRMSYASDTMLMPDKHLQNKETLKRLVSSLEGSITKLLTPAITGQRKPQAVADRVNGDVIWNFLNLMVFLNVF